LGRHSKQSRIRIPQGASVAAAPTLAGVVAAFCLSQQIPALASVAEPVPHAAAVRTAVLAAAHRPGSPAQLLTAARRTRVRRPASPATSYTVQPGDSLSAIAQRLYHNPAAWPVLYWRNHSQIRWADSINIGQVLRVPAEPAQIPGAPAQLQPAPPPAAATTSYVPRHASPAPVQADPVEAVPVQAAPVQAAPLQAAPVQAAPAPAPAAPAPPAPAAAGYSGGGYPGGAFGQCVVARESGGQPQIMNASGHYGLYQFSAPTWAAYGGNPADFGHASVAEQNQVFANALAQGGQSNWAPYDGC